MTGDGNGPVGGDRVGAQPQQGTVRRFVPTDCSGEVVDDAGRVVAFSGAAFRVGGLRQLRPGQRVRLEWRDGQVSLVTIATLS